MNLAELVLNAQEQISNEKKEKENKRNWLVKTLKDEEEKLEKLKEMDFDVGDIILDTLESIEHLQIKILLNK